MRRVGGGAEGGQITNAKSETRFEGKQNKGEALSLGKQARSTTRIVNWQIRKGSLLVTVL